MSVESPSFDELQNQVGEGSTQEPGTFEEELVLAGLSDVQGLEPFGAEQMTTDNTLKSVKRTVQSWPYTSADE